MWAETGDYNSTCERAITNCFIIVDVAMCPGSYNPSTVHVYAVYNRTTED